MAQLRRIYPKEQSLEATIERPPVRAVLGQGIRESTVYPVAVHIKGVRLSLVEKVFDTPYSQPERILHKHATVKR